MSEKVFGGRGWADSSHSIGGRNNSENGSINDNKMYNEADEASNNLERWVHSSIWVRKFSMHPRKFSIIVTLKFPHIYFWLAAERKQIMNNSLRKQLSKPKGS